MLSVLRTLPTNNEINNESTLTHDRIQHIAIQQQDELYEVKYLGKKLLFSFLYYQDKQHESKHTYNISNCYNDPLLQSRNFQ